MRVYVSHSIRGKFGPDATVEQTQENCHKATAFGKWLSHNFPCVGWYIPADHDEFVAIAFKKKFITETQLLDVDCTIVSRCQGIVFFMPDDYMSRGMNIEATYAEKNSIPTLVVPSHILTHNQMLRYTIQNWLDFIEKGIK